MKKTVQLTLFFLFFSGLTLLAQAPPTPPSNAGDGGGPVGGNAPVGSGVAIMLVLGAAYGGKKFHTFTKHQHKD
ncbi:MAG: hypothetical protein FD170_1737 [Bacteroidetes bacterium]|nr:MAG: hypothetical protein FD170_1737 [Bacteroidota bacterium]